MPNRRIHDFFRTTETASKFCYTDPEAHFNLGTTLQAQGDPATAESCFREALRLWPDDSRTHYQLGLVLGRR